MKINQYLPESGPLDFSVVTWYKASERLDHLRARKVGESSPLIEREYQTALVEFESACSDRRSASESRGKYVTTTKPFSLASGPMKIAAANWFKAKERLDHLRARKVEDSSSYVTREYQNASIEFKRACLARKLFSESR